MGRADWIQAVGRDGPTMNFTIEEHRVSIINLSHGGYFDIGDKLELIPSHVCPVVNIFDSVYAVRDGAVVDELRVAGRGKVR